MPELRRVNATPVDDEVRAVRDIKRLAQAHASIAAARDPGPASIAMEPPAPFSQRDHDLLLQTIDLVAGDWVTQLNLVRHNFEQASQLVLERAAKVKVDVTQLYLLGNAVLAEAARGAAVNEKLANELDKLREEPRP